jgi:phosphoglycerol transferase MdoB-like AlkP superfamily enzyme
MIFNYKESFELRFIDWLSVLWHGLRLDLSAGAYIMMIPIIMMILLSLFEIHITRIVLKIYNFIFLFIVLYLGVIDMELYSYWGFKLDITPLVYLKTPKEATASLNLSEVVLLLLFFLLLYFAGLKAYNKLISNSLKANSGSSFRFGLAGLLIAGLLIIPARGGIGIAPINLGSAYFHTNRFANHSAVNVIWNCVYSIVEKKGASTSHQYMEDTKAVALFQTFYPNDSSHVQAVKKGSNLILIILESFSNKIIGELGGESGITPEIDTICRNSLVFRNFFASGDRSEKGMLCIFSGYPSQPTTSIINYPNKTQNLPYLKSPFHKKGYYTAFYYGGDLNFANFRSYFTNPSEDRLVTLNDFPQKFKSEKWGVPDEILFNRMLTDIDTITVPFFVSCFTLSSHEPYDIPMTPVFLTNNRSDLSKNAFYYTDKCLGNFIKNARKSKWWENTLIIIIADHGSRYPGNTPNHVPAKYNIPMIWTGGALTIPDTTIFTYASQTDLSRTILNQYDLPVKDYPFSKDILGKNSKSFAMYFFNNGFGFMSDSTKLIYDNSINDYIFTSGIVNEYNKTSSKAYLQYLSKDFNLR